MKKTYDRNPPRGEKHPFWKGGIKHNGGYILIKKPGHPSAYSSGYVPEHRLVMENHLGRFLRHDENVHHINGDRSDNRIENLVVLSHNKHIQAHCGNQGADYDRLDDASWLKSSLDSGMSIRAIGRKLGCSHNAVRRALRDHNIKRN